MPRTSALHGLPANASTIAHAAREALAGADVSAVELIVPGHDLELLRAAWEAGLRRPQPLQHALGADAPGIRLTLHDGEDLAPRGWRWAQVPTLTDGTITLRPWTADDLVSFDPDDPARRFVELMLPPSDPADMPHWVARTHAAAALGRALQWVIADPGSGEALGAISVFGLDEPWQFGTAELAYWLMPAGRGRGLLPPSIALATRHALGQPAHGTTRPSEGETHDAEAPLGLQRIKAYVDVRNPASVRALQRSGFHYVGCERRGLGYSPDTEPVDCVELDLVRHDIGLEPAPHPPARGGGLDPALRRPTTVTGEQVTLSCPTEDDVPYLADFMRHEDVGPAFTTQPTHEAAHRWWATLMTTQYAGASLTWLMRRPGGRPVGTMRLFRLDDPFYRDTAEVGYWIDPSERGQGIVTEALCLLLDHALAPAAEGGLGLRRVRAMTSPENTASQKVLRRAGMRFDHVETAAVEPGSFGMQPTAGQRAALAAGDTAPSPDRWHYVVDRDTDRVVVGATSTLGIDAPVLDADGIRLRPWREADALRVVQACTDPRTRHWLATLPQDYDAATALEYIRRSWHMTWSGRAIMWAVADAHSDQVIGALSLERTGPRTYVVGYWTHPDARGRGVMSKALRRAVHYAFTPATARGLGARRLELQAAVGNEASARVAQSAGFVESGLARQAEPLGDGSFADLRCFDLLADDVQPEPGGAAH